MVGIIMEQVFQILDFFGEKNRNIFKAQYFKGFI